MLLGRIGLLPEWAAECDAMFAAGEISEAVHARIQLKIASELKRLEAELETLRSSLNAATELTH